MIEALLVVICLLLLKIIYQLIDIASVARYYREGHSSSVKNESDFRQSVISSLKDISRESGR